MKNLELISTNKKIQKLYEGIIWEDIEENYFAGESEGYEGEVVFDFMRVEFELESVYDEEEEETKDVVTITNVEDINPENILKEAGIEYARSKCSNSFYLKLADGEHRVSDHKRPAVVDGFTSHEHRYENEHIVETEEEIYDTIKRLIK